MYSYCFVLAFLLLRIVNVHDFVHFSEDEDQIHCELCDMVEVSHKITPFSSSTFIELEKKVDINFQELTTRFCYETSGYFITLPRGLYNKPPPTVIS